MKPIVAFDESGNSGANLLDPEQPVFVLASVHLSDERAASILGKTDKEVKFTKLKQSSAGRQQIFGILNSELLGEETVLISGFHKRFMVVTKIIDLLVEPMLYDAGFDLYERGGNIAMANMFYFTMPAFIGRAIFEKILYEFQNMVRTPSQETLDRFYSLLALASQNTNGADFAQDLNMLLATRSVAEQYLDQWDSSYLDPAIPAFTDHCSIWTGRLNTEFSIVHDTSKPIQQQQLILEAMMSATEPTVVIGYDRRKRAFPIKAAGIEFRDSSKCPVLQVADILASSAAHCLRGRNRQDGDQFVQELLATRTLSGSFWPLWPEPKVTPEELGTTGVGGIDPNNYVGAYIAKRLGVKRRSSRKDNS